MEIRTSILDTVLSENAVTPVAHATDGLHAACTIGWARVEPWVIEGVKLASKVYPVEALSEMTAHSVPCLSVRVFYRSCPIRRCTVYSRSARNTLATASSGAAWTS